MIVSADKKIGIFLVPKIGSSTIFYKFQSTNIPTFYCKHLHLNFKSAKDLFKDQIIDFDNYNFYAFYRDPIEKFKSAITFKFKDKNTFKQSYIDDVIDYFYDKIKIYSREKKYLNEFNIFNDVNENLVDMKEYMKPQVHWLDFNINLNLLDYKNFSDNVSFLLSILDDKENNLNLKKYEVNFRIHQRSYDIDLTKKQLERVIDMYSVDYLFFEKRGIDLL